MWGRTQTQSVESTARKLKDNATHALGKRKYEQAAEYYLALTHVEPEEPTHRMKLGALYLRLRAPQFAVEVYRSALELFEKQSSFRKAAAVAQIILDIEPTDIDAAHYLYQWRNATMQAPPLKPVSPISQPVPSVRTLERTDFYLGEDLESEGVTVHPSIPPTAQPESEGPAAADGWGWDGGLDDAWDTGLSSANLDPPVQPSLNYDGVGSSRTSRRR